MPHTNIEFKTFIYQIQHSLFAEPDIQNCRCTTLSTGLFINTSHLNRNAGSRILGMFVYFLRFGWFIVELHSYCHQTTLLFFIGQQARHHLTTWSSHLPKPWVCLKMMKWCLRILKISKILDHFSILHEKLPFLWGMQEPDVDADWGYAILE